MAVPTYFVTVNGTSISNVQEWSFMRGQQALSDPVKAGTGYVRGRRPDLLPTIQIGDYVRIAIGLSTSYLVYARVADFRIEYGEIPSLDTWEMDIEDALASLGRCTASFSWSAGTTTGNAISTVCTGAGVTLSTTSAIASSPCSAQVIVNENALEVFGRLMTQEQGYYVCRAGDNTIQISGRGFPRNMTTYDASDDGSGTDPIEYNELRFLGLADNYADKTIVEAAGLAQQSSGIGAYSTIFQTYNQTTGQAKDLADYLLGVYDAQVQTPSVLSAQWQGQSTNAKATLFGLYDNFAQVKIKFRTNTYYGIIIGASARGLVDNILFTYYLAAPGFYTQFTLDSPIAGILNTNRLGY